MTSEQNQMSKCRSCKQHLQALEFGQKQRGGTYKTCKTRRDKIANTQDARNNLKDLFTYMQGVPLDVKPKIMSKFKIPSALEDIGVAHNPNVQQLKYAFTLNRNVVPIENDNKFLHLCVTYKGTEHSDNTEFLMNTFLKLERIKHLLTDIDTITQSIKNNNYEFVKTVSPHKDTMAHCIENGRIHMWHQVLTHRVALDEIFLRIDGFEFLDPIGVKDMRLMLAIDEFVFLLRYSIH